MFLSLARSRHCISRIHRRLPASTRCVSLGIFRDKKVPPPPDPGAKVPSILRANTVVPPLRFAPAVSARPKRDKRRLPIFPPGNDWGEIRGGSAGDDAWVMGKYYLGTLTPSPPMYRRFMLFSLFLEGIVGSGLLLIVRSCGWGGSVEYKGEWTACPMVTAFDALLGVGV
jgi:hypothetical protein